MTYLPPKQYGEGVAITPEDIDGNEGSKGDLQMGLDPDGTAAPVKVVQNFVQVHDPRLHSLLEQVLQELQVTNSHLATITGEDYTRSDVDD